MLSLDFVLEMEIRTVFGPSFSFSNFLIESPLGPTQPNEFDCGVFVCMLLNDWSWAVNKDILASVSYLTIYRYTCLFRP